MAARETAVVFGVEARLGWAQVQRFVTGNMQVGADARGEAELICMINSRGGQGIRSYAADVSNGEDVLRVFDSVDRDFGVPSSFVLVKRRHAEVVAWRSARDVLVLAACVTVRCAVGSFRH